MEENFENGVDLYCQDGVLLKTASASLIQYLNSTGTLCIIKYPNNARYIEWKPNDVTVESDMQEEWAVVNTVEQRTRTLSSSSLPSDAPGRSKVIRLNMDDIKSFRVTRHNQQMNFNDKFGNSLCSFFFQHGNAENLLRALRLVVKVAPSRRDKHLYMVIDDYPETEQLNKSFAELNLFPEQSNHAVWGFVRNFQNRPYETVMDSFAKVTNIVFRGQYLDDEVSNELNRSLTQLEDTVAHQQDDEYEVVPHRPALPQRPDIHRGKPLNQDQWESLQDSEGRIQDVEGVKQVIFRGGITPSLRREVWKYLLGYIPWDCTRAERHRLESKKELEYYVMKQQWRTMTAVQENNFSDFRDRKSIIEKDVNRTDRTIPFYAGDDNPNLQILSDILMTYVMYNFDLGYVQGMSDLLSPILWMFENEVVAFWCFVGFMDKVVNNFDIDQAGMKEQLQQLHCLLEFAEPDLANYLDHHDSGNMFFCFRWLLVWFKREFSQDNILCLWEVLWTGLPCLNFHLLMCVAILDTEKNILMDNHYGFTEILKHINDLSQNIDLQPILGKAEGIYHQITAAPHLTNSVRIILGIPLVEDPPNDNDSTLTDSNQHDTGTESSPAELVNDRPEPSEASFETSLSLSYM